MAKIFFLWGNDFYAIDDNTHFGLEMNIAIIKYVSFLSWINSSNIKAVCSIRNKIYFVNLHVASCLKSIQVGNRKWFPRNINLTFCVESGTMFVVIAFGICLDSNFTSNSWPFQGVCKTTLHLHHRILIYFAELLSNSWTLKEILLFSILIKKLLL